MSFQEKIYVLLFTLPACFFIFVSIFLATENIKDQYAGGVWTKKRYFSLIFLVTSLSISAVIVYTLFVKFGGFLGG